MIVIHIDVNVCFDENVEVLKQHFYSTWQWGESTLVVFEAVFYGDIVWSFIILYKYEFKLERDH